MYLVRVSDITFIAGVDGLVIQETITIYVIGIPVSRQVVLRGVVL